MVSRTYRVRLPEFEGPLDVLLFLVQRQELPIERVPIADLVEQFLDYLRWAEAVELDLAAEFFVVAAELLAIKARWLLRRPALQEELSEHHTGPTLGETEEPLWERLLEYRRYKYAALLLRRRWEQQEPRFMRLFPIRWQRQEERLGDRLPATILAEVLCQLLRRSGHDTRVVLPSVAASVVEYMGWVGQLLCHRKRFSFEELVWDRPVSERVLFFLAVLELARQQEVTLEQEVPFAPLFLCAPVVATAQGTHAVFGS
ncbi:MAG: segregation/condensation protein A [Chlorobiota bacterium]